MSVDGRTVQLTRTGVDLDTGVTLDVWTAHDDVDDPAVHPVSIEQVAAWNGGRLPIGVHLAGVANASVRFTDVSDYRLVVEPRTTHVVSVGLTTQRFASLVDGDRTLPLADPVSTSAAGTQPAAAAAARASARHAVAVLRHRSIGIGLAWFAGALGATGLLAGSVLAGRRRASTSPDVDRATRPRSLV